MIVTSIKRRTIVTTVAISRPERYIPIDIRLPSNATCITGVLVTTSASWQNAGTVTLQASDESDIFYSDFLLRNNVVVSDEELMGIEDPIVDSDKPWVSGNVPELKTVGIAGDNVYLRAWFKGAVYHEPFTIRIYVEFEEAEEYIGRAPQQEEVKQEPKVFIL